MQNKKHSGLRKEHTINEKIILKYSKLLSQMTYDNFVLSARNEELEEEIVRLNKELEEIKNPSEDEEQENGK
ncbi:MAG: hypothetical protein E7A85_00230 [Anaerococcus sp.]|nr:hypothetical protein [Anaerococcus sp.]